MVLWASIVRTSKIPGTPTTPITELSRYWEVWEIVGRWVPSPNCRIRKRPVDTANDVTTSQLLPTRYRMWANQPETKEKSSNLHCNCKAIATASPRSPPLRRPSRCGQGARKYTRTVTSLNRRVARQGDFLSPLHRCTSPTSSNALLPQTYHYRQPATHQGLPRHYSSLILTAKCGRSVFFSMHQNQPVPPITFPWRSHPTWSKQTKDRHHRNRTFTTRKSTDWCSSPTC